MKYLVPIAIATLFAATYALVNRYELHKFPDDNGHAVFDRWTGEVCYMGAGSNGVRAVCLDRHGKVTKFSD
jgi:hypothetical protein